MVGVLMERLLRGKGCGDADGEVVEQRDGLGVMLMEKLLSCKGGGDVDRAFVEQRDGLGVMLMERFLSRGHGHLHRLPF